MDVGLRGAPTRAQPAPVVSDGAGSGRRTAAVLLLAVAALAATGWVMLAGLAAAPAVSPGEASFAVRAFAINRFGYGAAQLPWYDGGLAALQVAGYETVSGALRRSATVVVAAREAMVVATVLGAAALTLAARRLRLTGPATVAVPVLFGLAPAAVLLHRTADPANLAVLWACVALALAGGEARRTGAAVGSICYLAAAAVTSPLVLVALVPLFTVLLWSGDVGRLRGVWRWLVAALGVIAWEGLVLLAARGELPGSGGAVVPPLTGLDVGLVVAAIAAGVAGLRIRWLRALALALLATGVAAAVATDARGSLLIVALPLAAVVVPAAADAAFAAVAARSRARTPSAASPEPVGERRPVRGRRPAWLPVAVLGAITAVAVAAWVPAARTLDTRPDGPGRQAVDGAREWVLANLPSRPKLAVDDVLWASLVEAGYPADQLAAVGALGPDRPPWPGGWADCRYVVGRDRTLLAEGVGEAVSGARANSAPVAAFGAGEDLVEVRRVTTDADAGAQALRDGLNRVDAGVALARNPRLVLQPAAADLLRGGAVDARSMAVLAAITGEHSLSVADFPPVPGENARQPRRLIAVTAIDDRPVRAGAAVVTLLDQWLRAQQPPYRPAGTQLAQLGGRPVLLVRHDALGGSGLLPP